MAKYHQEIYEYLHNYNADRELMRRYYIHTQEVNDSIWDILKDCLQVEEKVNEERYTKKDSLNTQKTILQSGWSDEFKNCMLSRLDDYSFLTCANHKFSFKISEDTLLLQNPTIRAYLQKYAAKPNKHQTSYKVLKQKLNLIFQYHYTDHFMMPPYFDYGDLDGDVIMNRLNLEFMNESKADVSIDRELDYRPRKNYHMSLRMILVMMLVLIILWSKTIYLGATFWWSYYSVYLKWFAILVCISGGLSGS